jgi:hypothetical protein
MANGLATVANRIDCLIAAIGRAGRALVCTGACDLAAA